MNRPKREDIYLLLNSGAPTKTEPVPETEQDRDLILAELLALKPEAIDQKIYIAGLISEPREDRCCLNCIYYVTKGRWCNLPELAIPVEPAWWCRLWRS